MSRRIRCLCRLFLRLPLLHNAPFRIPGDALRGRVGFGAFQRLALDHILTQNPLDRVLIDRITSATRRTSRRIALLTASEFVISAANMEWLVASFLSQ
jgi:hypothetical protein